MKAFHIVMALIAAWRMTEVVLNDAVFTPVRKLFKNYPGVLLFFSCMRCVSVWAGAVATIAFVYFPWFNWAFASSTITLFLHQYTDATKRKITVFVDQPVVNWGGMTSEQGTQILGQAVAQLQRQQAQRPSQPNPVPGSNSNREMAGVR